MKIKNALVIYKQSAYKFYFRKVRRLGPLRRELKRAHKAHVETVGFVKEVLRKENIKFRASFRGKIKNYNPYDFIISVGGDGTFLEAARHTKNQPILGVNSDPRRSIGRHCTATRQNFRRVLKTVLSGRPKIEVVNRLSLRHNKLHRKINVLNDILICQQNPAAMSRYRLFINGIREDHRSSGLWIATAAGSSGAIRAAGGRELPQSSRIVEYMPRELFSGHGAKYRLRGGKISFRKSCVIYSQMRNGIIYVDGAHFSLPFSFGDVVRISVSGESLRVVDDRK